ncbi:MAG: hypothetical protein COV52_06495 [Gammaproteobacteria bacterium CG11_big_fil_rev_8_21_14_0_20_46_22]|nr:MAG: hypothetical protein COW05_06910 [Gammaproteobacteria bacterium CG12_big_fil_rev_8_21_14_0_65_46_12]PIR10887.1 MAG: hypothetical protein COV52_06495 [Gammaproteobacteria bacterium CG11_big_fil_rev_8_21_14_0_20_46_22]
MTRFLAAYTHLAHRFSSIHSSGGKHTHGFVSVFENDRVHVIADSHLMQPKNTHDCDAKCIAMLYLDNSDTCFSRLIGGFACLIWDKCKRTLMAAKDYVGEYSLYYAAGLNGEVYFSNNIKSLREVQGVSSQLNPVSIAKFLALITPDKTNTFFSSIKKVPSATCLHFKPSGEIVTSSFWDPAKIAADPLVLNQTVDYYQTFRKLYQEVIADSLRGKQSVASHLSGGLDSTSVTNLSAAYLEPRNHTVHALAHVPKYEKKVIAKSNWSYDDRFYIEAAARFNPNIKLHYIDTEKPLFHYTQALHPFMDQPPLNPSNMLWMFDAALLAQSLGLSYLLTGQAGNSTISWPIYPTKKTGEFSLKHSVRALARKPYRYYQRKRYSPWASFSAIHPEFVASIDLLSHYAEEEGKRHYRQHRDRGSYYRTAFCDFVTPVNTAIRCLHGVAHIDPTLDRRIVEFFLRVPDTIFTDPTGRSRLLVREGLKGLMPDCVLDRTSRGMQSANWYYWLDNRKEFIIDLLHHWRSTDIAHYIDLEKLIVLMKKWSLTQAMHSQGRRYANIEYDYHLKLLRAIEVGLFIEPYL